MFYSFSLKLALSQPSIRKEHVRQVESAKTQAARERRIAGIVAKLGSF